MPAIVETPSPKEAFVGFMRDLWRQVSKKSDLTKGEFVKIHAPEARRFVENNLFASAGILKPYAIGKNLARMLHLYRKPVLSKFAPKGLVHVRELLKVPQKEFSRVEDVAINYALEENTLGRFFPEPNKIVLGLRNPSPSTVLHEFVHARQWNPEPAEQELMRLFRGMRRISGRSRGYDQFWYEHLDPTEWQAYLAEQVASKTRSFDTIFRSSLADTAEKYSQIPDSLTHLYLPITRVDVREAFTRFLKKK